MPSLKITHDDPTAAAERVRVGQRTRVENDRRAPFRSHDADDPSSCLSGFDRAQERGDGEGEVGRFRRTCLVPIPVAGSLDDRNTHPRRGRSRREGPDVAKGGKSIALDHSPDVHRHKPGALKGPATRVSAWEANVLTATYETIWVETRKSTRMGRVCGS